MVGGTQGLAGEREEVHQIARSIESPAATAAEEEAKKKAFFNYKIQDPGSSDREGASVFYKDPKGNVFHTYSTYARGIDMVNTAYHYLDLVPKGRDEGNQGPSWLRRRDEYGN